MTYVTVSAELRHRLGYSVCRLCQICFFILSDIVELWLPCIKRDSDDFLYPVGKGKYFFSFYLEREFNNGVYAMEVCIIVHELVLWSNSIFGCKHISWRHMTNCVLDFVLYFCWFNRLCVSCFIWCEYGGCNRGRHNVVRCFL